VKLTVTAAPDAAPGKRIIIVTATPEDGNPRSDELTFNVKASGDSRNAGFDITGPSGSTSVAQGSSNNVTLTLKPGKSFKGTVKLEAKSLEGGVKCALDHSSVKLVGETKDVKLTVSADDTAAAGKRTVRITATPESGTARTLDLNFEVKKK
jgi:uncharacterized membrane protein